MLLSLFLEETYQYSILIVIVLIIVYDFMYIFSGMMFHFSFIIKNHIPIAIGRKKEEMNLGICMPFVRNVSEASIIYNCLTWPPLCYLILSLSYLILSYLILSYLILSYLILSYLILSYLIITVILRLYKFTTMAGMVYIFFNSVLRPFQVYFSSYETSQYQYVGENGRTPRKNTWHTRKQNLV